MSKIWKTMTNLSPTTYFAISLIAKDAVGCYMYTTTAKNNKHYTPEKRADVANYDLANGIINIALQILAIKPIEAGITKLSESKFMKHCFNNLDERLADKDNKAVKTLLKNKANLVKGSTALLSIGICQYIIKRFISPFFSMPASEKFQEWGLVKPKLYEGETYTKPSKLDFVYNAPENIGNNLKDFHEDFHDNLRDLHSDIHENLRDFHGEIKNKFDDLA